MEASLGEEKIATPIVKRKALSSAQWEAWEVTSQSFFILKINF